MEHNDKKNSLKFNGGGPWVSNWKQIALFLDYLKNYESYEKTEILILRSDDEHQYEAKST